MSHDNSFSRSSINFFLVAIFIATSVLTVGCGGNKMIPRDVKDYMAAEFKIDRRNFDVTIPFRTTIMMRTNALTLMNAREKEKEFITKFFDYCKRDNVADFQNDTLMFLLRLDTNPDINLKYFSTSYDAGQVVRGEMDIDAFIDRCIKEENWNPDLG